MIQNVMHPSEDVELQKEIVELKEKLPSNWATLFLQECEQVLKRRYTRQTPYRILNEGKKDHDGWKVIQSIAKRHQEKLAALS